MDNNYILTGSEETNIRMWKADPSKKIGPVGKREERSMNYRKKLLEKFKYARQIKDLKKTHLPKYLLNAKHKRQVMAESKHRKMENLQYNNPGEYEERNVSEKERRFVKKVD